jgi:hypothetical protein
MTSIQTLAEVPLFERIASPYRDCADSATSMVDSIVRSCIARLKQTYVGKHMVIYTTTESLPDVLLRPLEGKDIDTTYTFLTSPAYLNRDEPFTADKVSALLKIEEELRLKRSAKQMLTLERATLPGPSVAGNGVLGTGSIARTTAPVVSNSCSCLA